MIKKQKTEEVFKYNNIQKKDKNFMYKNLKRANCYNCDFSNSNFNFASFRGAHFKSCNLFKCTFKGTEFVGANLKESRLVSAIFEDTVFDSVNLDGADFKDAEFKNVVFLDTDITKAKNIKINNNIRVFEEMPSIKLSNNLKVSIEKICENEFVKKSRIFDTKDGGLNTLNIMLLLEKFSEEEIIKVFNNCQSQIDRDFYTLSYIVRLIEKNK